MPMIVNAESKVMTLSTSPAGRPDRGFSYTLTAAGAEGRVVWSLLSGSLPPGLHWRSEGIITGMPQARGTSLILVRASDSAEPVPNFADAWLALTVE